MSTYRLAGVDVPRIGLGTNRLSTAREHVTFVREALAAGVRHIDTAHLYTRGDSERAIGDALQAAAGADDVLVATKGGYGAGEGRPEVLSAQIEQSLRALRTDTIGLYYLHRVDATTPLEDSVGAIKAWVDRGAIAHVGLSAVSVEQIERARKIVPIAAVQNRYNLAERQHDDVVAHCEREQIAFVPFFPLVATAALAWPAPPSVMASATAPSSSPGCCSARRSSCRSRARSRSSICARTSRRSSSSSTTQAASRPDHALLLVVRSGSGPRAASVIRLRSSTVVWRSRPAPRECPRARHRLAQ